MKAQLICSLKGTSTRQIWETFGLTLKLECINHIKHWFYLSNADRSSLNMQFSYLFLCRLFITEAFFFVLAHYRAFSPEAKPLKAATLW